MDDSIKRKDIESERINVPANSDFSRTFIRGLTDPLQYMVVIMLCLLRIFFPPITKRSHINWFAMDDSIKRKDIESERINVPANSTHYWRYRMHITLEQGLTDPLQYMVVIMLCLLRIFFPPITKRSHIMCRSRTIFGRRKRLSV